MNEILKALLIAALRDHNLTISDACAEEWFAIAQQASENMGQPVKEIVLCMVGLAASQQKSTGSVNLETMEFSFPGREIKWKIVEEYEKV